jgi:hypothetical protein
MRVAVRAAALNLRSAFPLFLKGIVVVVQKKEGAGGMIGSAFADRT